MRLLLLFLLYLLVSPLLAGDPIDVRSLGCFVPFAPDRAEVVGNPALLSVNSDSPTFYKVTDPTGVPGYRGTNPFYFYGSLDKATGTVEFSVRTHLKTDDGLYRACWGGRDQFRAMLGHFGAENVKKIKGVWLGGDNIEAFDRLIKEGLTPEQAASQTWTGQLAAQEGFTVVTIEKREESSGKSRKVVVLFSRP